jgi:hypothetical protein
MFGGAFQGTADQQSCRHWTTDLKRNSTQVVVEELKNGSLAGEGQAGRQAGSLPPTAHGGVPAILDFVPPLPAASADASAR